MPAIPREHAFGPCASRSRLLLLASTEPGSVAGAFALFAVSPDTCNFAKARAR